MKKNKQTKKPCFNVTYPPKENSLCVSFYDDTDKMRFLSKVLGEALACRLEAAAAAAAATGKAASSDIGWKDNGKIKVGLSGESLESLLCFVVLRFYCF